MLRQALEGLAAQFENLTSMKLEKLRLTRLVKQLQEREVEYIVVYQYNTKVWY